MKIFILDDDRYFGSYVLNALKKTYSDVTYFHSERECMEALNELPDVLILDHKLENSTGFEIMEEVHRKTRNKTNVLYISAQEKVHVTLKALRCGALDYLEKDSNAVSCIKSALEKIQSLTDGFRLPLDFEKYRGYRV